MGEVFDRETALAGLGGDERLLGELAGIFLGECPRWLAEGYAAVAQRSADRLRLVAHTIKGAASYLGASGVQAAAQRLETMGRDDKLEGAEEAWGALEQAVDSLRPALAAVARPRGRTAASRGARDSEGRYPHACRAGC